MFSHLGGIVHPPKIYLNNNEYTTWTFKNIAEKLL
jgi:hypothetical protein